MRFGYWMPVFGGWLRNVADERMSTDWSYVKALAVESEQAVERALDWLARHQDSDGRWNGGVARTADGKPLRGEFEFTAHCPPGDLCSGPCYYWEADTAMTGLSLLAAHFLLRRLSRASGGPEAGHA